MAEPTAPGGASGQDAGAARSATTGPAPAPPDGVAPGATMPPPPASAGSASDDPLQRIIDSGADLLVTTRDWIKQETEGIVREQIGQPLQDVGIAVGSLSAAAFLLVLGLIFIAVAALVFLSQLIGVPLAFLLVGLVFLVGAGVFMTIKVRQVGKNAQKMQRAAALRSVNRPPSAPTAGTSAPVPTLPLRTAPPNPPRK